MHAERHNFGVPEVGQWWLLNDVSQVTGERTSQTLNKVPARCINVLDEEDQFVEVSWWLMWPNYEGDRSHCTWISYLDGEEEDGVLLEPSALVDSYQKKYEKLETTMHAKQYSNQVQGFNFFNFLRRKNRWSQETFGPGERINGLCDHIIEELEEIKKDPSDIYEWVDVIFLALDGPARQGYSPEELAAAMEEKLKINKAREWPDWQELPEDVAVNHIKR